MFSGQTGSKGETAGTYGTGPSGTISHGRLHFLGLKQPRVGFTGFSEEQAQWPPPQREQVATFVSVFSAFSVGTQSIAVPWGQGCLNLDCSRWCPCREPWRRQSQLIESKSRVPFCPGEMQVGGFTWKNSRSQIRRIAGKRLQSLSKY